MGRVRVAIVGASGYGGAELLRLLFAHPRVEVFAATSRRHAGRPVGTVHENLLGATDLAFTDAAPEDLAAEADALFFALPHGEAAKRMGAVFEAAPDARVIDLSGDFRLAEASEWEAAYGREHPSPELCGTFVYGLSELNREQLRGARRVANPGCFATALALNLLPLAEAGRLTVPAAVAAATGSSGSGAEAKATTHHPERAEDFRAYRPLRHQHVPEVEAALRDAGAAAPEVALVPHSAPLVRGIFATAILFPEEPILPADLTVIYRERYRSEPFVRLRETTPRVTVVAGTNFCDVAVAASPDGRRITVMTAIDNLGKGMAGQAVQNLNLMHGFPEDTGLGQTGTHP